MISTIELMAVISGAVFGVLAARRKGLDLVGVVSVAMMTAFGGGSLRDLLLDRHPLFWIEHSRYPVIVFSVACGLSLLPRIPERAVRLLDLTDALGLGLFSIVGTQLALDQGVPPFVAVLLGVITGSFGGVIADIVCNEVPGLFRPDTPLYATCAFAGGWGLIALQQLAVSESVAFPAATFVVVAMRLAALKFRIVLRSTDNPHGQTHNP